VFWSHSDTFDETKTKLKDFLMKFKTQTLLALVFILSLNLFVLPSLAFQQEEETHSLLLTELDFHDAIKENEYLLVNFHALWCRYSKKLKPEWKSLGETLNKDSSKVKLAKVEAYDEKKLAEEYGIEGYPTIKLFIKGTPHDYNGERLQSHLLEFVHRKLKDPLTEISDVKSIEDKLLEYEWVGVLIGNANEDTVKNVAFNVNDVYWVKTSASAVKDQYKAQDGQFVLVNNISKSSDTFAGTFSDDALAKFVDEHKFPAIPRFSRGTAERIFLSEDPSLILIVKDADSGKNAEAAFTEANKQLNTKIFMSVANYQEEIGKLLTENLGIDASELPTVRIVRADRERIRKYYLEGAITSDSIVGFYNDYKDKKAKRFYLSEPVPTENPDLVKKVVTKSFKDMVLNPENEVLIMFWAPWCGHCRAMMPVYDNVARKTREVPGFIVAKIDLSVNDVEGFGLDIVEYPTILLFTKKDKENPIEFKGERNEYVFNDFIRAHATVNLDRMKQPNPFDKNEL